MKAASTRKLLAWHRICGLIVSANVALFSVTGVILIFHDEINAALGVLPQSGASGYEVSLARAIELARETAPADLPVYVSRDPEQRHIAFVGLQHQGNDLQGAKAVAVDLSRGAVVQNFAFEDTFTGVVWKLHAQLMMGPVGALLVGLIGLAFLFSLLSGVVLYGPMMKRFAFGLLRRERQSRTLGADVHKLIGAATFGWNAAVVLTGVLLSLGSLLLQFYATHELAALAAPYQDEQVVTDYSTVDRAISQAERTSHGRELQFVALPGSSLSSPRHYAVLLHGTSGVDKRMLTLALVDARQPEQVHHEQFPWYLRALLLSEPLHFGDYGGMPLKIVWAVFALLSLALAGSGIWITVTGRKRDVSAGFDTNSKVVEVST